MTESIRRCKSCGVELASTDESLRCAECEMAFLAWVDGTTADDEETYSPRHAVGYFDDENACL